MHPAHIHFNSAAEGGEIALSLEPVDGDTGISETTVEMLDDKETEISFEDLMDFFKLPNNFKIELGTPLFPKIEEEQQNVVLSQYVVNDTHLTLLVDNATPQLRLPRVTNPR